MTTPIGFGSLWTGPAFDPHRYRVDLFADGLRPVGEGGEGLVYRAWTTIGGEPVALKMLTTMTLADLPVLVERVEALRHINHPSVMHHLEVFAGCALVAEAHPPADEFDIVYSAAEWVAGSPLEDCLRDAGPQVGLLWVEQIADATAALHGFRGPGAPDGFVHRDIKPSNVRITPEGTAVLIDFGIARPYGGSDLTEGVGTHLWKAPELIGGPGSPGKASDVWGVGALAYWTLVGEPPRLEGSEMAAAKVWTAASSYAFPDPEGLSTHIASLLETHPDRRPTDLGAWARELRAIAAGGRRRRRTARTATKVVAIAGLVAAVTVGGIALGRAIAGTGGNRARSDTPTTVGTRTVGKVATSTTHTGGSDGSSSPGSNGSSSSSTSTSTTTTTDPNVVATSSTIQGTSGKTVGTSKPSGDSSTQQQADTPPTTTTSTTTKPPPVTPSPPSSRPETSGGNVHTWTDYLNAGGSEGPTIPAYDTVQISCRVQGFTVADGNTWWYRIASSPWSNQYYGSADAFYNNGATSGSLLGTPFVDTSVPTC
jgi:serine/threonine protein kinase